jgi:hypothetical protein
VTYLGTQGSEAELALEKIGSAFNAFTGEKIIEFEEIIRNYADKTAPGSRESTLNLGMFGAL